MADGLGDGERADRATDKFPADLLDQMEEALAAAGSVEVVDELIAEFNATFARLNVTKSGDMLFVLLVPGKQKYGAMQASDHPNQLLKVTITKRAETYGADVDAMIADLSIDAPKPQAQMTEDQQRRSHYIDPEDADTYGDEFSGYEPGPA